MTSTWTRATWPLFLLASVLALAVVHGAWYGLLVPAAALAVVSLVPRAVPLRPVRRVDTVDLAVIAALYVAVVALFLLAFQVFTPVAVAGLFLSFGGAMLLGVAAPICYTVWYRGRPLADLGIGRDRLREALALGVALASVQFALTLWGYDLPQPVDWVPLAFLALAVGLFEAVFFRGFIQTRLEASFGPVAGVAGAAAAYSLYHVGYGMGAGELVFLFGLGVVYSIAFAVVRNVVVLWPLLVPMGSLFNNLESGDIELPWAAVLGFLDVLGLMGVAVWLAVRHERGARSRARDATVTHTR